MTVEANGVFLRSTVQYLHEVYLPRLRRALEILPGEDLWWRPHEETTSIGNLLLHLTGNVRQWILSGLGDEPDQRERGKEFESRDGGGTDDVFEALMATVDEACRVIEGLPENELHNPVVIQGIETTRLEAIYHVVEHFSWHTGQIVWMAKLRAGARHGLAFYDDDEINRAHNE